MHTDGTVFATGGTTSTNFPTQGSDASGRFRRTKSTGDRDAFVAKFSSAGNALTYSGLLGGGLDDQANAIALDPSGRAYVTGYTMSSDFPTLTGPALAINGAMDAFVARVAADGSGVEYSGFVGGNGDVEAGRGIAVAADGTAYAVGETNSTGGLPGTAGTARTLAGGGADGFVTKIDSNGTLTWLTLLAGSTAGDDRALAVAIDPADGNLLVAGETNSANFPANDGGTRQGSGPQNALAGNTDGFVVRMSPAGTSILGSSYLGGANFDSAEGIAADGQGGIYVTGTVSAETTPTFPTLATNGLSTARLGAQDGFVAKLLTGPPLAFSYAGFLGSNVGGSSVDDAMHALSAATGVSSVLSVGGSTNTTPSGFANSTSGALGGAGALNGVVLGITPYRTPLSIVVFGGSPQSAPLGSGFAQDLVAQVKDADGLAVAGFTVTFTPPGSGATATLSPSTTVVTDSSGKATVSATASGVSGAYNIQASAAGVSGSVNFQLTNLKLTQSITFDPLGGKTLGDAPFTVSATASSSLLVSFSATTLSVCTVTGNQVTLVGAGDCTIAADQGGDGTYAAARPGDADLHGGDGLADDRLPGRVAADLLHRRDVRRVRDGHFEPRGVLQLDHAVGLHGRGIDREHGHHGHLHDRRRPGG